MKQFYEVFFYILNRLKEPSSSAGIASVIGGIALCKQNEYSLGIPMIAAGLSAIFTPQSIPTTKDVAESQVKEDAKK